MSLRIDRCIHTEIKKKKKRQCYITDLIAKTKILVEICTRQFVILQPHLTTLYMHNDQRNARTNCILCMDIIDSSFLLTQFELSHKRLDKVWQQSKVCFKKLEKHYVIFRFNLIHMMSMG